MRNFSKFKSRGFTVDGTLLEAWAGAKSFQRKDSKTPILPDDPGNPTINFHGEKRCNQTHESTTDPDAKLARKGAGKEAKLSYSGNLLVENRNGLIVHAEVFEANGTVEREAALVMLEQFRGTKPVTAGGDKGYDTADFVAECHHLGVTQHSLHDAWCAHRWHSRPSADHSAPHATRLFIWNCPNAGAVCAGDLVGTSALGVGKETSNVRNAP
jgi:hypothetical protein